jgi:glycosyltransferase involved in cell wall biosynthesis
MKLLIATGVYPPESGGPATYTKLLEERLPRRGIAVTVLPFKTVRHLPKALRHIAYLCKCLYAARGATLIYALDTVSVGFPAALAARILGKKFVVRVPGDYAWEQGRQRFGVTEQLDAFQSKKYSAPVETLRKVQTFVLNSASRVVVPSRYMESIVSKWIDAKKIRVVYSSVDTPVPESISRPEGFLVVTAARNVPWKGIEGIQKAVAREHSWKFFLAENLPRAKALGWVSSADVFVLNSTYEGLSHALIEAMMLGTPVVATRVGGNPELIRDGVDGILIEPNNEQALYEALLSIKHDPESALLRAQSAKERAKQFSIEETIGETETVLTSI